MSGLGSVTDGPPIVTYKTVIDNTDGDIQYTGSDWSIVGAFADGYGVPVYNGSQSMAQGADHQFTYRFNGSAVNVFGSWDYTDNPLPMCEIDGTAIAGPSSEQVDARTRQMHDESDDYSQKLLLATNQLPLCGADGLEDGQHELVVKAPSDINTRLVFDYLVFSTKGYEGYYQSAYPGTYLFEANDVTLLGEWQPSKGKTVEEEPSDSLYRDSIIIADHNSSISLRFYGSQITMVGILDNTQGPPATGQFSIQGLASSTPFSLSNTINSRATLFRQTIFTSYRVPRAYHDILIQWHGTLGQQRFGFTNLYVEVEADETPLFPAGTTAATISPSVSVSVVASSTHSAPAPQTPATRTPVPVAAIVGGVVGALVAVTAAISFLWFLRRRRHLSSHEHSQSIQEADPQPAVQSDPLLGYGVEPFHPPTESVWSDTPGTSRSVTLSVSGMSSTRTSVALLKEKQSQAVRVGETVTESDLDAETTDFLVHQDSGVRLGISTREGRRVVEVPPEYTA